MPAIVLPFLQEQEQVQVLEIVYLDNRRQSRSVNHAPTYPPLINDPMPLNEHNSSLRHESIEGIP